MVRAARLSAVAQGGHVLLSETTRTLLGSKLPDEVSVFPLGERHLKDIDEPKRVYELEIAGVDVSPQVDDAAIVASDAPAPPSPPAAASAPPPVPRVPGPEQRRRLSRKERKAQREQRKAERGSFARTSWPRTTRNAPRSSAARPPKESSA